MFFRFKTLLDSIGFQDTEDVSLRMARIMT